MPFENALSRLIASVEGAEGAVMVAYDGEPVVHLVGKLGSLDNYGIQLLGAQFRVSLTKLNQLHAKMNIPNAQQVTFRMKERTLCAAALNEDYFVLLAVRNGHGVVAVEHKLDLAALALIEEM